MADNLDVTPGTGKTVATDEIASINYQRIKLIHGADGVNDGDVSNVNGLPVRQKTDVLATISQSVTATGVVGSVQDVGARSFSLQLTGTFAGTITVVSGHL